MYWLAGFLIMVAVGVYIKKRVDAVPDPSREDIAKTITDFIEGRVGKDDWDNFATYPLKDSASEKNQKAVL